MDIWNWKEQSLSCRGEWWKTERVMKGMEAIQECGLRQRTWHYWIRRALLMTVAHVTTKGHMDALGLCCHLKPYWCLWPVLPSKDMMVSVVHAVTRNHVKSIVCAAADCKRQGSFFCSGTDNCRLTTETERHRESPWQPLHRLSHLSKRNSLERKLF